MNSTITWILLLFQFISLKAQILEYSKIDSLSTSDLQQVLTDFGTPSGFIKVRFPVDFYKVKYITTHPANNEPIEASGAIAVPKGVTCELPLASYQHGTVASKSNVPSFNNFESNIGKIFASSGYVVCMPDYIGLGDSPGLHPYVHAKSEADAALDLLRAARVLQDSLGFNLNEQLFIFGYSQGGHATMALHKEIEEVYSDEFQVTLSVPMSGPYDLSGVQAEVIIQNEPYPTPGYLPYVIFGYQSVYGNFYDEVSDIFIPPYDTSLLPLFDGTVSMGAINDAVPNIPNSILVPEVLQDFIDNPDNVLRTTLAQNDLYDWTPDAPVSIMYCIGDDQVGYLNSVKAYENFIANGAQNVEFYDFGSFDHGGCLQFCLLTAYSLFEERSDSREDLSLSIINNPATIPNFDNGSIDVAVNGGLEPYNFIWNVEGENASTLNGLSVGTYTLLLLDSQNCFIDTTIDVSSTIGIAEKQNITLQLFPNPANQFVNLILPSAGKLSVYSSEGSLIYKTQTGNEQLLLSTSAFLPGLYSIHFEDSKGSVEVNRLIINH